MVTSQKWTAPQSLLRQNCARKILWSWRNNQIQAPFKIRYQKFSSSLKYNAGINFVWEVYQKFDEKMRHFFKAKPPTPVPHPIKVCHPPPKKLTIKLTHHTKGTPNFFLAMKKKQFSIVSLSCWERSPHLAADSPHLDIGSRPRRSEK